MNVVYSNEIKSNPTLLAAVEDATKLLQSNPGASAEPITVEWELVYAQETGQKRPLISLKIADSKDEAKLLAIAELFSNPHSARFLILQGWGNFLAKRTERMRRELLESGQSKASGAS